MHQFFKFIFGVNLYIFDVFLTVHPSIFISVINQLVAKNFCFTVSLFHAFTCFERMCSSSRGQNCVTQPLVGVITNRTNYCTNSSINPRSSSSSYPIICICNPKNFIFYRSQLIMSINENHPFHIVNKRPWPLTGAIGAIVTLIGLIKWFHQYDNRLLGIGAIITPIGVMIPEAV